MKKIAIILTLMFAVGFAKAQTIVTMACGATSSSALTVKDTVTHVINANTYYIYTSTKTATQAVSCQAYLSLFSGTMYVTLSPVVSVDGVHWTVLPCVNTASVYLNDSTSYTNGLSATTFTKTFRFNPVYPYVGIKVVGTGTQHSIISGKAFIK